MKKASDRAHSKYSASGAERWFECPGSVELSEGIEDKGNVYSIEGTTGHTVLEVYMMWYTKFSELIPMPKFLSSVPSEMIRLGLDAATFIYNLHKKTSDSKILVEQRVYLGFIDPEMFGTFDGAVLEFGGTLHVFDYKYGAGVPVSPIKNLQMIFYAIGLAHKYNWDFKRVRMWIIQPRIKGYDGPVFWEISIEELKAYVWNFEEAVARVEAVTLPVEQDPENFREGSWCHWCKAKKKCPLKNEKRFDKAVEAFASA